MVMKIENYEGTADTFTFPYNPQSYDDTTNSNHQISEIGFQRHHILISGGGIGPKSIILTGHFSGTNKRTNYKDLAKHFQETTKLKKLYFHSDRFALGVGQQCKETNAGGRTNFIDYVASFQTVIGILLGDTEKTSGTNAGDVKTYVTEVTGTVTSGASDVTIEDADGVLLTIPSANLTTGDAITYKLVSMVDSGSGIYVSEYAYVEIEGTETNGVQVENGFLLQLDSGSNITTVTTTNLGSVTKKFRDGWSS